MVIYFHIPNDLKTVELAIFVSFGPLRTYEEMRVFLGRKEQAGTNILSLTLEEDKKLGTP